MSCSRAPLDRLARHPRRPAGELGLRRVTDAPPSQIVVLDTDRAGQVADRLREHGVRATALGDRIRFGFHYFNDESDVQAALGVLT